MATGVMDTAVEFVVGQYKKNPNLTMSELQKLGKPEASTSIRSSSARRSRSSA